MSSTGTEHLSQLRAHVLGWLLCHTEGTATDNAIATALFGKEEKTKEHVRRVAEELAALESGGLAARRTKKSFSLTKAGRERMSRFLAWDKRPERASFRVVRGRLERRLLSLAQTEVSVAPIAGLPDEKSALALAKAFLPEMGSAPVPERVLDAIAWHALGVETSEPFTLQAVLETILSKLAGSGARLPLGEAVALLEKNGPPATPPVFSAPKPAVRLEPLPEDDAAFARLVLSAARASKTGRFGDDRVFISHVQRQLVRGGRDAQDTDAFKARLVSAHRQRLLSLRRADLVEAMRAEDVDESETRYLNATFHFVRLG